MAAGLVHAIYEVAYRKYYPRLSWGSAVVISICYSPARQHRPVSFCICTIQSQEIVGINMGPLASTSLNFLLRTGFSLASLFHHVNSYWLYDHVILLGQSESYSVVMPVAGKSTTSIVIRNISSQKVAFDGKKHRHPPYLKNFLSKPFMWASEWQDIDSRHVKKFLV